MMDAYMVQGLENNATRGRCRYRRWGGYGGRGGQGGYNEPPTCYNCG